MKSPVSTQSPRKFSVLVLFVFLALFIAVCVRPLGNNRMADAVLGSFERFIGILIEHYAGKFPVWLAPEQARILTVSEKSAKHAETVYEQYKAAGILLTWDNSSNKLGYKLREARNQRIPYLLVIGERDQENGTVSVRSREEGDLGAMSVQEFQAKILAEAVPRL